MLIECTDLVTGCDPAAHMMVELQHKLAAKYAMTRMKELDKKEDAHEDKAANG